MKKAIFVILGICLLSGFAVAQTPGGSLGAFQLVLKDNFQYGTGYQGDVRVPNLMNGYRLMNGDRFTLKVTFTIDRDLENPLCIGFADQTPGANYWRALSWNQPRGGEYSNVIIPTPRAGQTISAEVQITLLRNASNATPLANTLVFESRGEGRHGTLGSGVKGPATISFTEFVLTKN
ncbi:MAG: hypothetical protein FWD47_03985 [Treponema sp.]|nr:hypothetical protein [Treponema sp.]